MKIKFENVGRSHATWVADYPRTAPLEDICSDERWWMRQLRGKMMSTPDWCFNKKEGCVDIWAGFRHIGTARIMVDGSEVGAEEGEASDA